MRYKKITISGRICTGKSTLFGLLDRDLRWNIFSSSAYFRKEAEKKGLSIEKAEEQNNVLSKKIDYMVRDMLKANDELIVEGWMVGVMAEGIPDVLKVLLTCPDDIRYERYAIREHVSLEEAKKDITDREHNLLSTLHDIYGIDDILDPKRYNIVIDTSVLNQRDVLEKVTHEIHTDIHKLNKG